MQMSPEEKTAIILNAVSSDSPLLITSRLIENIRSIDPRQTEEFKFVPLDFRHDELTMTGYTIVNNMPLAMDFHIDQLMNIAVLSATDHSAL
jgi:hypothetical protein